MSTSKHPLFSGLFPQPKHLSATNTPSSISSEATLITCQVSPQQKRAIRTLLTAAGMTFIPQKGSCIVNISVDAPENFPLSDVPEELRQDYYELTINGSKISIRAPYQSGITWGVQTLTYIYRHLHHDGNVPNLSIRDWPSFPYRGIFVEDKWGTDRMTLDDWKQTVDTVAELKMNLLGIGLYGCWGNCRFETPGIPANLSHTEVIQPLKIAQYFYIIKHNKQLL